MLSRGLGTEVLFSLWKEGRMCHLLNTANQLTQGQKPEAESKLCACLCSDVREFDIMISVPSSDLCCHNAHTYTYTYALTDAFTYMHLHMHPKLPHTLMCTHICIHIHSCTQMYLLICTHSYMYTNAHISSETILSFFFLSSSYCSELEDQDIQGCHVSLELCV